MAKIGIDAEKFFKEHLEKHYEEFSLRIGESVEKAIKEQMNSSDNKKITMEEAIQGLVATSIGAATGETITFLISAMARAIDINNAKIYFELIGSKRKGKTEMKINELQEVSEQTGSKRKSRAPASMQKIKHDE